PPRLPPHPPHPLRFLCWSFCVVISLYIPPAPPPPPAIPQPAAALAYAGALPLILAAVLVWAAPDRFAADASTFAAAYGTMLLIFFGGVRWGVAVMRRQGPNFIELGCSLAPALAALPLLFIDAVRAELAFFLVAFPVLLWDDLRATRKGDGAPQWYLGVRIPLTILMVTSFAAALAGLFLLG
ncbi:MAG: DUF3429 family protein, partial [Pseudomonadota bacterium]